MSADSVAKIVLFVGNAGGIASSYPQLLSGIPGARKHRGMLFAPHSGMRLHSFLHGCGIHNLNFLLMCVLL